MISFRDILSAIIVLSVFALHPSLNKGDTPVTYLHYLVYGNTVNVSYNNTIDKNKIIVKWECENQYIDCTELTIIKNGKQINKVPFEQGNQKLVVYYDGRMVGNLPQEKAIKNHAHKYTIDLKAKSNLITFKGNISGPSPNSVSQNTSIVNTTYAGL